MRRLFWVVMACAFVWQASLLAQTPQDARVVVTVADQSGAIIPKATVTVVNQAAAGGAARLEPIVTSDKGVATFERLAPGVYTIQAEFSGFEAISLKNVRIRSGDNRNTIVLPLKTVEESLTVARDAQIAAADPKSAFATTLSAAAVDALSDDPNDFAQQLQDMAGGNAVISVDSFLGGSLPPKSQIKSIHIVRDAFAAENHSAEADEIQIITQPGLGPIRGSGTSRFRDGSMSGRSPFTPTKGPERTQSFEANVGGSLVKNKSSFSISVGRRAAYDSPTVNAATPGGIVSAALNLKRPNDNWALRGLFDYAMTRDQVLRLSYEQSNTSRGNLGIGAYDVIDRGYGTDTQDHEFHAQIVGPLGRRFFGNTRLQVQWTDTVSHSTLEAATIRVNDAFTMGGAQIAGGRHPRDVEFASDVDYIRGLHTVRGGVLIDGGRYRSDDSTNYLGTYTFTSLDAYNAGQPATFTKRIGDPLIEYWNMQAAAYVQDDIRVNKSLTLSPGLRYEAQTHLHDLGNLGPRFGVTWAPLKSGKTTLRASAGIFYNWLSANTYEQTLRVDGFRQQELDIVNPSFPDPGLSGAVPATNRYLLGGDVQMARTVRFSGGIDQALTPQTRLSITYQDVRGANVLRGLNLNVPVNGVRPDSSFANVVEVVSDATSRNRQIVTTLNVNLAPPGRATDQARWNWRRTTMRLSYWLANSENDSDGAFSVPATGTLATEWGPAPNDRRHRVSLSINTQTLKNLSTNLMLAANSGTPYTVTTGADNNGDSIFNDRPAGVARNTLRTPWQATWSANASYTIPLGAPTVNRYRLSFNIQVANLTNRSNFTGFSGVMTSPFFQTATAVANPRKIDIGMGLRF